MKDEPTIADVVGSLCIDPDLPDARATWHRNYTPLAPWIRAHVLKQAMGWNGEKQLADHFEANPELTIAYGFNANNPTEGSKRIQPQSPTQSRLWEMWHEVFSNDLQDICHSIASELVELAREEGIPAPDNVFQPANKRDVLERPETRLIADTTKEVWQQAKPFVTEEFYLKRGDNAQIHENAFWEQHAFMGVRKNMFAESGANSFYVDSTRDRTPSGSTHRWQIRKLSIEEMRRQHRHTTKRLIERARSDGELVGKLWAAIDVTKGAPFTGEMDTDEDENVVEPYILGRRDGNYYYYQWASIQIVGHDIPIVLDAIPQKRGMAKDEIVDELLEHATEIVDDIDLVMMDREFDSDPVKDTCEEHGVSFLNPKRKFTDENDTVEEMKRNDETVRIIEQPRKDQPNRKNLFLPSTRETPEDEETKNEEVDDNRYERPNYRQEMRDELGLTEDDIDGDASPLGRLLREIRGNEPLETANTDGDGTRFVVFQTNHPFVSVSDENSDSYNEREQMHMVARLIRWYRHRWGIENGYKKIKTFMVRTTSTCPRYRFFNFMFACVLYNAWRLVDLLIKLSLEVHPDYSPRVDANQFVTIAKQYYGLDPPD